METAIAQVMVFTAILMLFFGIRVAIRPSQRPIASRPLAFRLLDEPVQAAGGWLEGKWSGAFPAQLTRLRNLLLAAGLQDQLKVQDILGLQAVACAGLFLLTVTMVYVSSLRGDVAILAGLFGGVLGWILPIMWLTRVARDRQEAISRSLPYAIDLLTITMQAGLDFGAALRILVQEGPKGPLTAEFAVLLREVEFGKTRAEALKDMADRIQLDEARALASAVVQSSEMGASIAETLKLQAEELRRSRFHKAERKAARAPSIMLIPLALFILPAVFIVILVPVIMRISGISHAVRLH